jgi:xylan 1,4-beta-xylosidase
MDNTFRCNLAGAATSLPHFWEHTVGSDHALMALRADWQQQLRRARDELGFRYVRFHGLFDDDVGTVVRNNDVLLYSFFNVDQIMDFLLSIGMKPFVELGFMPEALASGDKTVFHYRGNITPPTDYGAWATLVGKLVAHWVERYGLPEVRSWFFEVWNEPNLHFFWSGSQSDYFTLYRHSAQAIKAIDAGLRVGGPATAVNAWIPEFLEFCAQAAVPVDFISTHHYPNDAFGTEGQDTVTQLSKSPRSTLRDQSRIVRTQAGSLPVYYTEWCSSSNPRDPLHDEPYAAAFVMKTILEANGLVQAYSYWTFSDIFEENYFPSVPFHGGFGLLNIHGIAKPTYRAFELLHQLGTETLQVEGSHPTLDAWVVRRGTEAMIVVTNFALPRQPINTETVRVVLRHDAAPIKATLQRIDEHHANAKRLWLALGAPEYLDAEQIAQLQVASRMQRSAQEFRHVDGHIEIEVVMPALGIAAVTLQFATAAL